MASATAARASEPWDAVVLGAGIAGLIATSMLLSQGSSRVLVLDRYPRAGGNHLDVAIGPYTFDIGTFLFQAHSPLMRYFPQVLPLYTPVPHAFMRVDLENRIRAYPFSPRHEVIERGPLEWLRVAGSVAGERWSRRPIETAADYARYWVGDRVFRTSGLEQYIERFYGARADEIEVTFAEKRMRWIADAASTRALLERLRGRLRRRRTPASAVLSLVRPRSGFAAIYDAIAAALTERGAVLRFHSSPRAIRRDADLFVLHGDAGAPEIRARRVISTIPLRESLPLCGLPPPQTLESATLVSLFYSFHGNRGFASTMLYNFSRTGDWKRITMASDFYGCADGREFFTVEINRRPGSDCSAAAAHRGFRDDIVSKHLFSGDLVLEGCHVLADAYPVYRRGATAAAAEAVAALRAFGVESFGRQGAFDYLPNTRDVVATVESALVPR